MGKLLSEMLAALLPSAVLMIAVLVPFPGRAADDSGIRVSVDVPGVRVYLNGEIEGLAHPDRPLVRTFLPAGMITVKALPPEGEGQTREIRLAPGEIATIAFSLRPVTPRIQAWYDEAARHFREGRLTSPDGENAFHFCRMILEESPNHSPAADMVLKILERQLAKARAAEKNAAFSNAGNLYDSYLRVADFASDHSTSFSPPRSMKAIRARLEMMRHLEKPVDDLIAEADRYYKLARYVTPASGNALDYYRAVLLKSPNDSRALEKLHDMAGLYPEVIAQNERKSAVEAATLCDNYLEVLEYLNEIEPDGPWANRMIHIRIRRARLRTMIREADEWTRQGDLHFIAQRFTRPKDANALKFYQKALMADPTHFQARFRVREMLNHYRQWGDDAFERGDHRGAEAHYERYQTILERIDSALAGTRSIKGHSEVGRRLALLRNIDQWLERGDAAVRSKPDASEENTGFYDYLRVIEVHPENRVARKKIEQFMKNLEKQGDAAEKNGKFAAARSAYRRYLTLSEALEKMGAPFWHGDAASVRSSLEFLDKRLWTASLADAEAALRRNLNRYSRLMVEEIRNRNVASEMAAVIEEMIETLQGIEALYNAPLDDRPVSAQSISRVRRLRAELEIEGHVRREKAF